VRVPFHQRVSCEGGGDLARGGLSDPKSPSAKSPPGLATPGRRLDPLKKGS
jgi:hypothetical protein